MQIFEEKTDSIFQYLSLEANSIIQSLLDSFAGPFLNFSNLEEK